MDTASSFQAQAILFPLFALFIFYHLVSKAQSKRENETKAKNIGPPEPLGAWPLIGHLHLLRGATPIFRTLGAMADRYGPIISLRLGLHRALIISNSKFVKECFTIHDKNFATRPSIAAGKYLGYDNAILALAPYGRYWRETRKIATLELLSSHRLELLKHFRVAEINSFIKDLGSRCTERNGNSPIKVKMNALLEHMTFNIIIGAIAGKRYSTAEYNDRNSTAWMIEKAFKEATYLSGLFVISDVIPCVEWMDIGGHVSSMKKTAKEIDGVIQNWLDEHIREPHGENSNDFMNKMLSTLAADDTVLSGYNRDTIVKATSMILILTGSGSTSITLTWAISILLNNPHVLKKAQEEIDTHVGKNKWVQESDIKDLNYLQAIVKETFRLYPPSPMTGIRVAMEDCSVGGYYIPKGTRLFANIWKLHRDPSVWTDPLEFRPERFLTDATVNGGDRNFEYIPFSCGRRSCPGMGFGLQVVHLTLARLIQGFDFATVGGMAVDMTEGLGLALPKLNPLEMVLRPRMSLELYEN